MSEGKTIMRTTTILLAVLLLASGCSRENTRKVTRTLESVKRATVAPESELEQVDRELREALEDMNDEMLVVNEKARVLSEACADARSEFGRLCDTIGQKNAGR